MGHPWGSAGADRGGCAHQEGIPEQDVNNTDRKHLVRAVEIAKTGTARQMHGALIAHGPRVLAVGVNTRRAHPSVCSDPKAQSAFHAEIMALRALRTDVRMDKLTIYSARVLKDGTPALAKPCTRCQAVLEYEGLTDIYWTED